MQLSSLLKNIYPLPAQLDRPIHQLFLDSREVKPGGLFLALSGHRLDGRQFIDQAIDRGAVAILLDAEDGAITYRKNIPLIPLSLSKQLSELAARFYDYPAKQLRMIGVTGTSGKTSCTHFIAQIFTSLEIPCGLIGTLGSGLYNHLGEAGLTTPDPILLQKLCREIVDQNAPVLTMEVSSHSIAQKRIQGLIFEIGIFTNLSQDHLDYHGDMETYANVKKSFLLQPETKNVIINLEDSYGIEWLPQLTSTKTVYAYSIKKPEIDLPNVQTIFCERVETKSESIKAFVVSPWGRGELELPLVGAFNLRNALAVFSGLCLYGIPFERVLHKLGQLQSVPGRMQKIIHPKGPLVVIDYAHKPDALEKVLAALRSSTQGQLICVFGCGGERDRGKRPLMAKIAERLADKVIVTNDNSRHEDPLSILAEIKKGFARPEKISVELDRSKAIEKSIQWGQAGDCILIAGKG